MTQANSRQPDSAKSIHVPVLIVGAGPVGLGMAIELGSRNIKTLVIDEGGGDVAHPRTGLIIVRTMELARKWGIANRIRNAGFPPDYELSMVFCTSLNGHLIAKEPYPSMRAAPTPPETPEKKQRCPQSWMQPILADAARDYACNDLRYGHRFNRFVQHDSSVVGYVTDLATGDELEVHADYLLACDGAGSSIRTALGIEMQGRLLSYSINILITAPGLTKKHRMGEAERYIFTDAEGTWGNMTVVDGDAVWRITVLGSQEKMNLDTFDADYWVRRALGANDIPYRVDSVIPWRRSELLAERFLDRRVILVGDAAHTTSPTGGMGMNTGMQEVFDLGWKLDAVLKGWAGSELLASYEAERRPIAARNLRFSTSNYNAWRDVPDTRAIADDTDEGRRLRESVGGRLRESTRVEWESLGLQIGHRYEGSPICIPDGTPPVPDDFRVYVPTARPGSRAPHAWLADGRSMLDLFGAKFVLLAFSNKSDTELLAAAFARRGVPFVVERITDSSIADLYEMPLVLVRPDGHVAWRGTTIDNPEHIVEVVRGAGAAYRASGETPQKVAS
ncbi:MAG: FAD-dependent monooxygenase [Magnetospirillum sp.]|nr:FAD-dependent monooxygenase [Magnetospirillum sp.]